MFEWNVGLLIVYLPVRSQNIDRFSTGLMEVFHLFVMIIISVDSIQAATSVLPMGNVNYVNTVILRYCIHTTGNSVLRKSYVSAL
jgi:hypothetical protein